MAGMFSRDREVMSEINVTPLVDVMLVLLIIFMVTAPMLKMGIDVDLPKTKAKQLVEEERFTVVINRKGQIYLNDRRVTLRELNRKLSAISKRNPELYIKADRRVSYGLVVKVMAEVKDAGIEKVGLVTEPIQEKKK
ncbi:MAG: protein TolR [Nitrospirae bacterium]|nr:MAG: protein TolR [Nitrospirota bacterium]